MISCFLERSDFGRSRFGRQCGGCLWENGGVHFAVGIAEFCANLDSFIMHGIRDPSFK